MRKWRHLGWSESGQSGYLSHTHCLQRCESERGWALMTTDYSTSYLRLSWTVDRHMVTPSSSPLCSSYRESSVFQQSRWPVASQRNLWARLRAGPLSTSDPDPVRSFHLKPVTQQAKDQEQLSLLLSTVSPCTNSTHLRLSSLWPPTRKPNHLPVWS